MTLRTFLIIIGINITLIFVANISQARPINFCTSDQNNDYTNKITKLDTILTKWTEVNDAIALAPPLTQTVVRKDSRYVKMLNLVSTVTTLKTDYQTSKDLCVLETDSSTGTSVVTTVNNSEPVLTNTYVDSTSVTTDENGSTVTTITRTTTVTSTITRTTIKTSTPYTTYTYNDNTTETINGEATATTSSLEIATVQNPTSTVISTTVTANQISTETVNQITSSYTDSGPTVTTSYTDSNAVSSAVVTNGSPSTTTTTSDGDSTQSSSYVDSSTTVDNGNGTSTTTVTRTTTVTTTTPRYTRTLITFARNTKTYSTVERTTTSTSTITRTTTTLTTPITTVTYSDGSTEITTGSTVTSVGTEDIVSTSSTTADVVTLVSNVDSTVTQSDTTTTENIVTTSTSNEVISTTTTENEVTTSDPEYYQTDEYAANNGSLAAINSDNAYARGFTGDGVKVGVLDTGVRCTHDDIDDNMSSTTYNTFYGDGCTDTHGHGTHVAGIIAAEKNNSLIHGVAYDAEIHSARIGEGPYVYISLAASVAEDMADNGVSVANLSANYNYDNFFQGKVDGYDGYSTVNDGTNNYYYHSNTSYNLRQNSSVIEWKDATDKGMIIVNSAGNQGLEFSAEPGIYTTAVDGNGDLILSGRMIIVGSVNNNGTMSVWSNKAGHFCQTVTKDNNNNVTGCADVYETKNYYIVAPGETINSLDSDSDTDTQVRSGTSMAAPHVTGAIAILKEAWPQLNADQIISLLFTTATDLGETGVDEVYGNGMLNLDAATDPQGTSTINSSSGTSNLSGTSMITSSTIGDSLSSISAFDSTMIVDSYNRDYYINLNKAVIKNNNALTLNHTFKSFSGMEEIHYNQYTFGINDDNVNNVSIGYKNGTCGYTLGNMEESNSFLGNGGSGALELGDSITQYVGINCNKQGFTFKYDIGNTNINGTGTSIIKDGSAVSDTWKIGYTKNNWLFEIGQPLAVRSGNLSIDVASSVNSNGSHNYSNYMIDINPDNRHTTANLSWNNNITDSFNINFGIGYDNNYANIDGDEWNAVTGVKYVF